MILPQPPPQLIREALLPPPGALPAPGWATRARLLAVDLITFDPHRLGWMLALRAMLALAPALLLAHALGLPLLLWVGLGAYLLSVGDSTDDGDRAQPLRIMVGALLGGAAFASGVLLGGSLPTAVAGMLFWGLLTGMLGVYGNAFATMALPVAWAYVELGLPASDHTLSNALSMGGSFTLGGVLVLALALILRFRGTFAPVRAETAVCFRAIAEYLEAAPAINLFPPEQRVRGAIAEARRRAAEARGNAAGPSRVNQQALVLIEIADRLYSMIGAMRERGETPAFECKTALLAIARVLDGKTPPAELRRLGASLDDRATGGNASPECGAGMLAHRVIQELRHALSVAAGDELPVLSSAPLTPTRRIAPLLSPLLANLDRRSVIARHALRLALVTSAAVVVFWVFPKPFGYWVPLTATVVLKPLAGMTLARAVQRAIGTGIGILVGLALMPLLPTFPLQFTAVIVLFFAMMAVLPFNYSLAILFLSAGIIPLEHLLTPGLAAAVGLDRLIATAIGATLALVGGHVLWPTFERQALPDLLRASTEAMSAYADSVIDTAEGDAGDADMAAERRRAGLALSNLQTGVQRSLTELGGNAEAALAMLRASTALQRLSLTLNALLNAAPELAPSRLPLAPFRAAFVSALANPRRPDPPIAALRADIPAPAYSPEAAVMANACERLTSALEMLRDAAATLPGSRPVSPTLAGTRRLSPAS